MGLFELREIQAAFMRHQGVTRPQDLKLENGDYIVWVYDADFNVRVEGKAFFLVPDSEFDKEKATVIDA